MRELLILAVCCGLVYGVIACVPVVQQLAAMRAEDEASKKAAARAAQQNLEEHGESFNSHVKE